MEGGDNFNNFNNSHNSNVNSINSVNGNGHVNVYLDKSTTMIPNNTMSYHNNSTPPYQQPRNIPASNKMISQNNYPNYKKYNNHQINQFDDYQTVYDYGDQNNYNNNTSGNI